MLPELISKIVPEVSPVYFLLISSVVTPGDFLKSYTNSSMKTHISMFHKNIFCGNSSRIPLKVRTPTFFFSSCFLRDSIEIPSEIFPGFKPRSFSGTFTNYDSSNDYFRRSFRASSRIILWNSFRIFL